MTPIHVLLVEDRPEDAELVLYELRRNDFEVNALRVETEAEYLAALARHPQIILADYSLPQFSAIRALELLKESGLSIPFIVVSGTIGEENAVLTMTLGASDYVLKDRLARLGPTVRRNLQLARERLERRAALDQVRRLSQAVEQSPVSIVITDTAGLIEYVNPKFEAITGYSAAEVMGLNPRFLKTGKTTAQEYEAMWATIAAGGEWRGEFRTRKKNGDMFWELVSISAIRNTLGEITQYLAVKEDITEKKELEKQVQLARRMEGIGALAGGMAHDLNNILAPILMCVPMLRGHLSVERFESLLATIQSSAERGADIVKQVLAFNGETADAREEISVSWLIEEMMRVARESFSRNIRLESVTEAHLWKVSGNATQLHQVLLNLFVNARDAMLDEGGVLRIRAVNVHLSPAQAQGLRGALPGDYVLVEVADSGSGISSEIRERIFEPFFTTKPNGTGTGLGLSAVASIVRSHGGFVSMEQTVPCGSIFKVYLPAQANHVALPEKGVATTPSRGTGQLLLVVDDEASIRTMTQAALEMSGYRTLLASDGSEGLALYAQHAQEISLVLTDLVMPFIDGFTLIRALRRINPEIKVIASSGYAEKTRLSELRALNVSALLDKPYAAEALLSTVAATLES